MKIRFARFIASGFGSGYSPVMPGTCGTIAALPVVWFLYSWLPMAWQLVACIMIGGLGLWACAVAMADPTNNSKDPQWIVIDEWAGIFITLLGAPQISLPVFIFGFVLFRIFDMTKPGPVGWAERLPNHFGVMADDVVAGIVAWAIFQISWTWIQILA